MRKGALFTTRQLLRFPNQADSALKISQFNIKFSGAIRRRRPRQCRIGARKQMERSTARCLSSSCCRRGISRGGDRYPGKSDSTGERQQPLLPVPASREELGSLRFREQEEFADDRLDTGFCHASIRKRSSRSRSARKTHQRYRPFSRCKSHAAGLECPLAMNHGAPMQVSGYSEVRLNPAGVLHGIDYPLGWPSTRWMARKTPPAK